VAFGFIGCSSSNSVQFAMFSTYQLRPGELSHYPVPEDRVEAYGACCWMENQSIFLNRSFTYPEGRYDVHIGVGESMSRSTFNAVQEADTAYQVFETKAFPGKQIGYQAQFVERDGYWLCRVNCDEPKSGLFILIDYVFVDESSAREFFTALSADAIESHIRIR
jgi:hypothetical protein